jgi:hypothetical protein
MKMGILIAMLLVIVPFEGYGREGYIGLYADPGHSVSCVTGVGFYPVEMWIWCLPVEWEQICAEFAIQYPSNVIRSTVTSNDALISVTLGDIASGISVCYVQCQYNWYWLYHQLIYVIDDTPTWIEIVKHPDSFIECPSFAPCYYAHCAPG